MWPSQIQWRERLPATLLTQLTSSASSSRALAVPVSSTVSTNALLQSAASSRTPLGASATLVDDETLRQRTTLLQTSAQGYVCMCMCLLLSSSGVCLSTACECALRSHICHLCATDAESCGSRTFASHQRRSTCAKSRSSAWCSEGEDQRVSIKWTLWIWWTKRKIYVVHIILRWLTQNVGLI